MSTVAVPNGAIFSRTIRSLRSNRGRWVLLALLIAACCTAAAVALSRARSAVTYVTAPVVRQTLVQTVTASGVVNPQNNVSVGTQASGTISQILVDYNSKVKKGQVLARLDPSTFQAQLAQARAALAQAQAQVAQADANANGAASGTGAAAANALAQQAAVASAQANAAKTQAALSLAQTTLSRDTALLAQGYLPRSTVDTDRANVAQDQADVSAAQAAIAQSRAQAQAASAAIGQSGGTQEAQVAGAQAARANVAAAQAVVQQDELNVAHTVITSPVDGTVVARDVAVGQTVAASLQTPTLFAIAQDLAKMEVDINVGEPDIGNVKPGEDVDFSVLAYPNRTFHGTVSQVRINPQTVNNVVTYDVVVLVSNAGGALLPGMTANASIQVATANDALVVPLPAVHTGGKAAATPWGAVAENGGSSAVVTAGSNGFVFVRRNGAVRRVPVFVALATATQAALVPSVAGSLQAGDAVVVATAGASHGSAGARNGAGTPMGGPPMGGAMRAIH